MKILFDDGTIRVRKARLQDVSQLEDKLRVSDVAEIWASDHVNPKYALFESYHNSTHCFTIENGSPIAMFGVVPDSRTHDVATVWLLAADTFSELSGRVAKHSKNMVEYLLTQYSLLENFVDANNKDAVKFLEFLKADISEPIEYGVEGKLFRYFCIRKEGQLSVREKTNMLETAMLQTGKAEIGGERSCPVLHKYADGCYIRQIFMPKGMIVVSKIHKKTHPYFVLRGKVRVSTEEGIVNIEAPYSGITEAGTRRTLLVLEDTIWSTVHVTDKKDLEDIEQEIIAKNFHEIKDMREGTI